MEFDRHSNKIPNDILNNFSVVKNNFLKGNGANFNILLT